MTGHLLAVIQTQDNFYATAEKRIKKQFNKEFLESESILILSFKNK